MSELNLSGLIKRTVCVHVLGGVLKVVSYFMKGVHRYITE